MGCRTQDPGEPNAGSAAGGEGGFHGHGGPGRAGAAAAGSRVRSRRGTRREGCAGPAAGGGGIGRGPRGCGESGSDSRVRRPGAAGAMRGSRGGGSGRGARVRPGAHWLGGGGPGSVRTHKGGRSVCSPAHRLAMPPPPPALPWLLAACCLCALPRGSGTSRPQHGEGGEGRTRSQADPQTLERVGSPRGAPPGLGSAAPRSISAQPCRSTPPPRVPAGFPQPFSRYRDGVDLPKSQVCPFAFPVGKRGAVEVWGRAPGLTEGGGKRDRKMR